MNKVRKSRFRNWMGALLCAVMLIGAVTVSAGAAQGVTDVTAQLRPDLTIVVDGSVRTFYNAAGSEVHPLIYNGTTYLPLRAIGELMDKNVNWDQSTLTVTLSGTRGGSATAGTPDKDPKKQEVSAQIRPDFTIVVDGTTRTFADAGGRTVYPLLYNGSVYLPLRAIGELMGKTVSWDGDAYTATLSGNSLVTDADSFNGTAGNGNADGSGSVISADTAKAKALAHAGLSSDQVTFEKSKLGREDGRQVYEVEFYTADRTEYDYEIDAYTGAVISYGYEAEKNASSGGSEITQEKAKELVLAQVSGAGDSDIRKFKVDYDDGRTEYEGEIVYGGMKYEFEIDASSGTIRSWEAEPVRS